jgi:hypothetical protein
MTAALRLGSNVRGPESGFSMGLSEGDRLLGRHEHATPAQHPREDVGLLLDRILSDGAGSSL